MQKSVMPRHVSFSVPQPFFNFCKQEKTFEFHIRKLCVKSAKASRQNACTCACKKITLRSSSFPQWCMKKNKKGKTWYDSALTDVHIHQQLSFCNIFFFFSSCYIFRKRQSSVTWLSRKRNVLFKCSKKESSGCKYKMICFHFFF